MNPNQPQSNIPQGTANVPAPVTVQAAPQTAAPVNTQALQSFIEQSKAASQARFGNISDTMAQHGYIFNPMNGQFERDPSYVDPSQAVQNFSTLSKVPGTVQYNATAIPPNELENFIDPVTHERVPLGTTYGEIQGKKFYSPADVTALNGLQGAQDFLDQVKKASAQVNTGTVSGGPTQDLKYLMGKLGKDTNAQTLLNAGSQANLIASSLLNVNRFNSSEISALTNALPTVFDNKQTAQSKLQRFQEILDKAKQRIAPSATTTGGSSSDSLGLQGSSSNSSTSSGDGLGIR